MDQEVKVGDYVQIMYDNAGGTTEKKGAVLKVIKLYANLFETTVSSYITNNIYSGWTFHKKHLGTEIKKLDNYTNLIAGSSTAMSSSKYDPDDGDIETLYGIYNSGDWYGNWEENAKAKSKIICECGQSKIANHEGDPWEQHSTYCPIYKEGKVNAGK